MQFQCQQFNTRIYKNRILALDYCLHNQDLHKDLHKQDFIIPMNFNYKEYICLKKVIQQTEKK